jgi:hypothetical protein
MKFKKIKERLISYLIIPIFWFSSAQAQIDSSHPGRLAFFTGIALPTGHFAATTSTSPMPGFANTGFTGGIEFSYKLFKMTEIGLIGNISRNSIDVIELQNSWKTYFSRNRGNQIQVSITTSPWIIFDILGSMGFNTTITDILRMYGKMYTGILVGVYPETSWEITDEYYDSYLLKEESKIASSVGYGIGFGLIVENKMDFGLLFLNGEPWYDIKKSEGDDTYNVTVKRPSNRFLFRIGIILF